MADGFHPNFQQTLERMQKIFFSVELQQRQEILAGQQRMVHYTSAEVALSIIQNRSIWMRNSSLMNDWSEVNHGLRCLSSAYKNKESNNFGAALDEIKPGLRERIENHFDSWQNNLRQDTYLTCVSEHLGTEDQNGRLSMWRAYGGQNGVALVFKSDIFGLKSDVLKAYSSPVIYGDEPEVAMLLARAASHVYENLDWLREQNEELIFQFVFSMWRFACLCTKHPGFSEEREWRIVYSPRFAESQHMQKSVKAVRGVPQIVYELPFQNFPEEGHTGAELPELLERVIIGPTSHPFASYQAFVDLLTSAGVKDAHLKVFISGIPLR